jgi:hypothetical protein
MNFSQFKDTIYDYQGVSDAAIDEFKAYIMKQFRDRLNIDLCNIKISIDENMIAKYVINVYTVDVVLKYCIYLTNALVASLIYHIHEIDTDVVRRASELIKYPVVLNDKNTLYYDDNFVMCCNGQPVSIVNMDKLEAYRYIPFYKPGGDSGNNFCSDEYIRMGELDRDGMMAFIAVRYQYGMNVVFALFESTTNTVYFDSFKNFDYPCGEAIRLRDGKLEIYLNNDDIDRSIIYRDENQPYPMSFDTIYNNSEWTDLDANGEFNRLYSLVESYTSKCETPSS